MHALCAHLTNPLEHLPLPPTATFLFSSYGCDVWLPRDEEFVKHSDKAVQCQQPCFPTSQMTWNLTFYPLLTLGLTHHHLYTHNCSALLPCQCLIDDQLFCVPRYSRFHRMKFWVCGCPDVFRKLQISLWVPHVRNWAFHWVLKHVVDTWFLPNMLHCQQVFFLFPLGGFMLKGGV